MIGQTLGHYSIVEKLGEGGMGEVYLAEDSKLERRVALKVLPPEMAESLERLERFEREARAVASLNHPNIVHMYTVEESDGLHFFTMELVEGRSLGDLIPPEGMELERLLSLGSAMAEALAEAHAKGIVHRDLKPSNIMVDKKGNPKILDFGLAKLRPAEGEAVLSEAPTEVMTTPGVILGTYPYMSPEQAEGREAEPRSDLFSLGVVLYEMATGNQPFAGDTPASLISAILKDPHQPLLEIRPEMPAGLESIVDRCLEKQLQERYPSSEALFHELEELREALRSGIDTPATAISKLPGFLLGDDASEPSPPVFVGREVELAKLGDSLNKAIEGRSQVQFVTGEAGTGKTALLDAFTRQAISSNESVVVASGGCNAHTGAGDPYGPFRSVLCQLSGDVEDQWAAGALDRGQALRLWSSVPLIAETMSRESPDLVDIFVPGRVLLNNAQIAVRRAPWLESLSMLVERKASLPNDVTLQQSALFSQCTALIRSLAKHKPVVLVLEDLHWSDPGSVSLLFQLARDLVSSPVLIVGTYRPSEIALGRGEERHPLEGVINELQRERGEIFVALGQSEGREFLDDLVDSEPNRLSEDFRSALFQRTQGHALFTVELLSDMKERGLLFQAETGEWVERPELDWEALPARVEGAIGQRVARLPDDLRELLTVASVEGEEFTAEVLSRVREEGARSTVRRLSYEIEKRHRLITATGLKSIEGSRLSLYKFRHVLIQNYLYDGLDEAERSYLHEDVGKALEDLYAESVEAIASNLARHFKIAGVVDKAIEYLATAANGASAASAYTEAIEFLHEALSLAEQLPESTERDRMELSLLSAICTPLVSTRGWGNAELAEVISRSEELVSRVGEEQKYLPFVWFLSILYGTQAKYRESVSTGERVRHLAQQFGDQLLIAAADMILSLYKMYLGDLSESLEHSANGIEVCGPEPNESLARAFGLEPGVASRNWHALTLLFLGYADQGRSESEKMFDRAKNLGHPATLAYAYFYRGWAAQTVDWASAKPFMQPCIEISEQHGLMEQYALGLIGQGWVLAAENRPAEGLESLRQGMHIWRTGGASLAWGGMKVAEATLLGWMGRDQEGLEAIEEGLEHSSATGERLFGPELWRIKAALLLSGNAPWEVVEECLKNSLEWARQTKAKLFELRAVTDLARLWCKTDRGEEGHELLKPVYDWFTEGFDIPDLQKAKALLEEFGGD